MAMQVDIWKAMPYIVPLVAVVGAGAVLQFQTNQHALEIEAAETERDALRSIIQSMQQDHSNKVTEILVSLEGVRGDLRAIMRDLDRQ